MGQQAGAPVEEDAATVAAARPARSVTAELRAREPDGRRRLREARGFVFDMDGVLYRGGEALPGVSDLFNALELRERPYILATNNSMSSPAAYRTKLAEMGLDVPAEQILTSGTATRDYLVEHLAPGSGILFVGMPALAEQLFGDSPFHEVQPGADEQPGAVVVGLDLHFTYDKLKAASDALRAGAEFVATNTDATLPTERGLVPGAGSIVAAVATASGREPTVIGKPSPRVLVQAAHRLGVDPADAVMVGDRLDTDVLAGHEAGMLSVLVLTGVSTRDEIAAAPVYPDLVFTDLLAMLDALVGNE